MKYFVEMDNCLKAIFTFDNFIEALDFVNQVGDEAEQLNHHPDILIHQKKNVTITTTTRDQESKVTAKDWELANRIEALIND